MFGLEVPIVLHAIFILIYIWFILSKDIIFLFSAVICPTTIPTMPNGTIDAITDLEERILNDTYWHTFNKSVKYRCPEGHVLEVSGSDSEQTDNPTEFEILCDADRRWRPQLPSSPFAKLPVMPACIRKFYILS